ncbi:hypothetical protein CBR_g30621, partial [Chara braunii]
MATVGTRVLCDQSCRFSTLSLHVESLRNVERHRSRASSTRCHVTGPQRLRLVAVRPLLAISRLPSRGLILADSAGRKVAQVLTWTGGDGEVRKLPGRGEGGGWFSRRAAASWFWRERHQRLARRKAFRDRVQLARGSEFLAGTPLAQEFRGRPVAPRRAKGENLAGTSPAQLSKAPFCLSVVARCGPLSSSTSATNHGRLSGSATTGQSSTCQITRSRRTAADGPGGPGPAVTLRDVRGYPNYGKTWGGGGRGGGRNHTAMVVPPAAGLIPFVDFWQPNIDSQSIAPQLFAVSLFPYLGFLYHLTRSKSAPRTTLFGFYFLLAFVGATIPAGIY